MRRFSMLLLSLLGLSMAAHASTISAGSYEFNNAVVFDSNHQKFTLTGDLTLDSNGLVTAANITLNDPALGSPVFNVVSSTGVGGNNPSADFAFISGKSGQLALSYLTTTNASGDIDLCIGGVNCNTYQASYLQIYGGSTFGNNLVNLSSGTLHDPPAAVPEPGSLALLATGVLGGAGMIRRRFVQS